MKSHAVGKEVQSPLCLTWENRLCITVCDIYESVEWCLSTEQREKKTETKKKKYM